MRQGFRFFLQPGTFFNQLQWSSNHWVILISFLVLATIDTQVGRQSLLYHSYATHLTRLWGVNLDIALRVVMAARLAVLLSGAFTITLLVWIAGNMFGKKSSRRVLFRRLAVVFTVLLTGFTVGHFTGAYPVLNYVSWALYAWGLLLGYVAIKEQFWLTHPETVVVAAFAFLAVFGSWHFSHNLFERAVWKHNQELAREVAPPAKAGARIPRY